MGHTSTLHNWAPGGRCNTNFLMIWSGMGAPRRYLAGMSHHLNLLNLKISDDIQPLQCAWILFHVFIDWCNWRTRKEMIYHGKVILPNAMQALKMFSMPWWKNYFQFSCCMLHQLENLPLLEELSFSFLSEEQTNKVTFFNCCEIL